MKRPNFREASTKRGIVWIVGGVWVLIQAARGYAVNPDAVFNQVDFWLGVIMTLAGAFGLLPDEPKTAPVELPPIDLQARPESGDAALGLGAMQPADQLRQPVSPDRRPGAVDPNPSPRFGSGFGDRD